MRRENRKSVRIPVSITIDIEQDKWLRQEENRNFNLSRFVRESLQKKIEEIGGDKE